MLKLMYITNQPEVAKIADEAGVDRIFIDLETLGKEERQPGMDTVKSHHEISDIGKVRASIKNAEVLVRVNHIHEGSEDEIEQVIEQKPDIIMLPYFKTVEEVKTFLSLVDGRVKTNLLVETPEAVECIDEILKLSGIDEVHIGLNDLHLGYQQKFMFELLADNTVDVLCAKFRKAGVDFGFGGIASLGKGTLPADYIVKEHYRLGSSIVILSRSFCNTEVIVEQNEMQRVFQEGVKELREYEKEVQQHWNYFSDNRRIIEDIVHQIVGEN